MSLFMSGVRFLLASGDVVLPRHLEDSDRKYRVSKLSFCPMRKCSVLYRLQNDYNHEDDSTGGDWRSIYICLVYGYILLRFF
jgi:hypothetical protein